MHCLVAFWMPQAASETVSGSCNEQLAQFTIERQPILQPAVKFPKTSFKDRSIQIKGNFTKLTLHFTSNVSYIMLVYCFVPLLSITVTFYSKIQAVVTP